MKGNVSEGKDIVIWKQDREAGYSISSSMDLIGASKLAFGLVSFFDAT